MEGQVERAGMVAKPGKSRNYRSRECRRTLKRMSGNLAERVSVDLTPDEARVVVVALQQFEPFWPSDMDASTRSELLESIRAAIDRVTASLSS